MDSFAQHKNDLEKRIVETVITSLEKNSLEESQLAEIADFVLGRIDTIQTQEELIAFLNELSFKWPLFSNLSLIEKGDVKDKVEDEVAEGVETLAQTGKIDDAIDLAKTITQK